jgi:quinol monooxygenase YgiN
LTPLEAAVILIVLKVKIRPEKRNEWLAGIKQYTADVRQEPGNVSFDYYENSENPNEVAIIETFADSDAGSAHVATEHAQKFFPFMSRVVSEKPKINYQDLAGEAWSEMAEVSPE